MIDRCIHLLVLILMLAAALLTASCQSDPDADLVALQDWGDNAGNLVGYYYAPRERPTAAPLVVVLHGCSQDAAEIARLGGWNRLADRHGFVVLYPQQRLSNSLMRCFNWFTPEDVAKDSGEAQSIQQMVTTLTDRLSLDETSVYVTGMSAGGGMTSALLALYPETFQAGAIMSGMPYAAAADLTSALRAMEGKVQLSAEEWGSRVRRQNPGYTDSYPALAVFQGMQDDIVDPSNADELAKQWSSLHDFDLQTPIAVDILDDNANIKRTVFHDRFGDTVLLRYDIDGLGHAIAVDPGSSPKQGGTTGKFAKDVDFYSSYWAAQFFGLTN